MEKNFPFINLNWFDKRYDKLVVSLTKTLDNGLVFKKLIVFLFHILSFVLLFGGIWFSFQGMFGDSGYFKALGNVEGFQKFTGIIGFIIGLPIALFLSWYSYSLVRKRAFQLEGKPYDSILSFLFKEYVPASIIVTGELATIGAVMMGTLSFFATLLGSMTYVPLQRLGTALIDGYTEGPVHILSNYDYFSDNLVEALGFVAFGLVVLIAAYAVRDIYSYLLRIALSILNPMLVFTVAFGLSVYFSLILLSEFRDGGEIVVGLFVGIILIYIMFMLLKKHVFKNWHEKTENKM